VKDASAPQGVVTFGDEYLFEGGGLGTLLMDLYCQNLPDYVYFHSRKSVGQLLDWTMKYGKDAQVYWESDLTEQEKGMSAAYVALITDFLMPYLGFKSTECDFFRKHGIEMKINGKEIGVMTFSGMLLTFLSNSTGNVARIAAKYNITPGTPCKKGGDDFLCYKALTQNPDYAYWEQFERAIEKIVVRTDGGSFVGYYEKKGLMIKDPELLLMKLLVHKEAGHLAEVTRGYFLDFTLAYRLGDLLHEIMTPEMSDAHQILTRLLMNARRELHINHEFGWDAVAAVDEDVWLAATGIDYSVGGSMANQSVTDGNKLGDTELPLYEDL